MRREHFLARVFRALSGRKQGEAAEEIGVPTSLIGQIETGQAMPSPEHLQGLARGAGLAVEDGDELLSLAETLRRRSLRAGPGVEGLFAELREKLDSHLHATYRRILTLPLPDRSPSPDDRAEAAALWAQLEGVDAEARSTVVRLVEEYQSWALCERACREAERKAAADPAEAAALVRLAEEIAEHVRGPEGWRDRLRGYVLLHRGHILIQSGDPGGAGAALEEARLLWHSGSDPDGLLDPGRLLEREASAESPAGRR